MSSRTALAPGNDRNSDTVSGARPLGAPRPGRAGEPLALRRPSLRGSPPDFPGPARLAASRPPPDLQACRPSPTPQPSPSPGGAPSSGPLCRPSVDRFRLGFVPPGSPLPCLPGAPPSSGVFLSPFPFRPPAADRWPPPGFAGLLTPRPKPGPLAGRPGPVLPPAPALPAVSGYWASQEPPSSHSRPSAPPGASWLPRAPPRRKPLSTFSWAQGLF